MFLQTNYKILPYVHTLASLCSFNRILAGDYIFQPSSHLRRPMSYEQKQSLQFLTIFHEEANCLSLFSPSLVLECGHSSESQLSHVECVNNLKDDIATRQEPGFLMVMSNKTASPCGWHTTSTSGLLYEGEINCYIRPMHF